FNHPSKEILIFPRQELRPEWDLIARENPLLQKHVSGPPLFAVDYQSSRVRRTVVKLAFNNPSWRFVIEVRLYRTEDPIHSVSIAGREQGQQPPLGRKFVVVNKGNKTSIGILDRFVPR